MRRISPFGQHLGSGTFVNVRKGLSYLRHIIYPVKEIWVFPQEIRQRQRMFFDDLAHRLITREPLDELSQTWLSAESLFFQFVFRHLLDSKRAINDFLLVTGDNSIHRMADNGKLPCRFRPLPFQARKPDRTENSMKLSTIRGEFRVFEGRPILYVCAEIFQRRACALRHRRIEYVRTLQIHG